MTIHQSQIRHAEAAADARRRLPLDDVNLALYEGPEMAHTADETQPRRLN